MFSQAYETAYLFLFTISNKKEKKMTIKNSIQPIGNTIFTKQETKEIKRITEKNSVQKTARLAGILYLVIAVAAIMAHMVVPSSIIVPGDAATTANNIRESAILFRVGGIGSELLILLSEIVLSVVLYVLLRPVNKTLSLLAAISRLAMTTIHGINLINYFFAMLLVGGSTYLSVFSAEQTQSLAMLFLEAHSYGFTIGIAFLTLHVFILGYLIIKSGYFPKILGLLFLLAGVGYLVDSFALLLSATYQTTPVFIQLPIAISELAFPIWLLVKGVHKEKYQERLESTV